MRLRLNNATASQPLPTVDEVDETLPQLQYDNEDDTIGRVLSSPMTDISANLSRK